MPPIHSGKFCEWGNGRGLENGRCTGNTAKARGRQAGKEHKENQSRSALSTQQPRQAEHARETGAGLLKESLEQQHKGESKSKPKKGLREAPRKEEKVTLLQGQQ
eukprot:1146900-Pelagomonas_calceolata.AAC.5